MNYGVIIWLSLLVVFLIAEASTVMLISLWFAAGSLAALIVCLLGGSWGLQVGVALVVSNILLLALRPLVRKYFNPKLVKTNVDSVVGTKGLVTIAIDNVSAQGQVKLGAMVWTARSSSGEPIAEGVLVRVDKVEGVKVFVTPVEVLEKV
ncbi:MAG: NfeD family protein [Oscillospiraceae bacterium]|nr:NfeD family protein [Oscillospiraceae bacterium]MBR1972670.1 NfeD family protein [Oscillospiraceae bacterium]